MSSKLDNILRTLMNAGTLQLKVITSPVEFYALRGEWDDLWSRANGRHHQAFTVCWLCWLRIAEPHARKLRIILLRENGRLVAVWPLVSYRKFFWTVLRPLSPEATDHTSILVEDGPSTFAFIDQLWRTAHQRCDSDIILLPYLSVNSDLHSLVSHHRRVMVARQHFSAVAKLRSENDWGAYCASLGMFSGRKPGARQRRLAKQGEVEIRVLGPDDADENARMVDWMLACKREWADRVGKKGEWLSSNEYRDFLIDLLNQRQGEVLARLLVVSLDGAAVAVNVLGLGKSCIDGVIGSFDPKHGKFAPGTVAMEASVKWVFEQGFDLDLGIGPENFKGYWSRDNFTAVWSIQIANTRWGLLAFAANNLVRRSLNQLVAGFYGDRLPIGRGSGLESLDDGNQR
jgi:CelD/BcsL family acetyltransferase involved in cellulose biosynthesis